MAVPAPPWASLAEQDRRKMPGEIDCGERGDATHVQPRIICHNNQCCPSLAACFLRNGHVRYVRSACLD